MRAINRKKKFLVIDVETANDTDCPLVYDIGFAVCDNTGRIYETQSLIINDIFYDEIELMETAYYSDKIPYYLDDIEEKWSRPVDFMLARWIIRKTMEHWGIDTVCAYNASFDVRALNTTLRYITKSKYRWFFPYGTQVNCIWHMACQVLYTKRKFARYAVEHKKISNRGNLVTNAEVGYRFISGQHKFHEEHRGLDDVLIECQIMAKCYKQHKKMNTSINRRCWSIPTEYHKEYLNKILQG